MLLSSSLLTVFSVLLLLSSPSTPSLIFLRHKFMSSMSRESGSSSGRGLVKIPVVGFSHTSFTIRVSISVGVSSSNGTIRINVVGNVMYSTNWC
ncbi:hypothetical protein RND81_02G205400 [Saponaria officinalis]|uniref:Secreted protein n=1 Tax=Saponaria officinalis TaxID=3572 RepID=A0AAW1MVG2_SAPOF